MAKPLPMVPQGRYIAWSAADNMYPDINRLSELIKALHILADGLHGKDTYVAAAVSGIAGALTDAHDGLHDKWTEAMEKARVL